MLNYFLWYPSAELFSIGRFTFRWDGLLLILAFLAGRRILISIYKKEGQPVKDVERLVIYMILAAFLGARLGHALFFQPQLWLKPWIIFIPFDFKPSFHLTGMTGFSSHGAVVGILLGAWLYSRGRRPGQEYLQVLDRISILSVWIAIPILLGSFLNSESEGKPTNSPTGTIMLKPVMEGLMELPCCVMRIPGGKNPLTLVHAIKDHSVEKSEVGHHSIAFYLFFKSGTSDQTIDEFMVGDVKAYLYTMSNVIFEPGTVPLHYAIFKVPDGANEVRVRTTGIARYPVQLYESVTSLILFGFLLWYWSRHKSNLSPGRIFGFGMILFWSFRFAYEFLKVDQISFMKGFGLNKGQILCIPLILIGITALVLSYRRPVSR